jgi:hypothetical protein
MTWAELRTAMDAALKTEVVPLLRAAKFKGSFPHFRRPRENQFEVLGFQYSQYGPQFYVEIATCSPDGVKLSNGKHIPAEKVKYYQGINRRRIGVLPAFDFEHSDPIGVAKSVVLYLIEAESWWQKHEPRNP